MGKTGQLPYTLIPYSLIPLYPQMSISNRQSTTKLSTTFCGIKLSNPTILPAGFLGTTVEILKRAAENGAGAVTIKSISPEPRNGHKNPTVITFESGMLNAVGYSNSGVKEAAKEFSNLNEIGVPVIASIIGMTTDDFLRVIDGFGELLAVGNSLSAIENNQSSIINHKGFSAIEIPLSCPHTPGFGMLAGQSTPEATFEIVSAVRKAASLPLFVKLSPNVPDIGGLAKVAEDAGANAITAINTMGPGMVINIEARRPVLDFKVGGVSGPALRPIAVRCVYDIYKSVKIPIIGVGGIATGRHAIEMIMAGASAVGIGTAIYNRGVDVFGKVCKEIEDWMDNHKFKNINEMIGAAHE